MDSTLQSKHTFDPCALLNALEHRGQGTPHGSNVFNTSSGSAKFYRNFQCSYLMHIFVLLDLTEDV